MHTSRLALAVMACGLAPCAALAGGFALSEQSVSAMGTANAGRASMAQDASVVYNNPAAMLQLKQAQVTGAVAFIDAYSKINNANGGLPVDNTGAAPATNNGDMVPHSYIPSGYFTTGDKGGWAWGVGVYGSYGLKTNYEPGFQGRLEGDKSSIKVTTIQPVIAYRINDQLTVAAGPTFNRLDALLTQAAGVATTASLKGHDTGYGYNVGLHATLNPNTQAGLVYRSKVRYGVSGTLSVPGPAVFAANAGITLPESLEASLSHKLDARNTLHAGVMWTRWSRLQSLDVSSAMGTNSTPYQWKDSTGYSVGLTHQCDDKLQIRAGLAYDNSPVNPAFRNVRLPSADRYIASLGAGYKLGGGRTLDASYSYIQEQKATVAAAGAAPNDYTADYRNRANVFGLQFTQAF